MSKMNDLTGCRFGKLVVLEVAFHQNGYVYWKCQCDCGNTACVRAANLKSGAVKSCGCLLHKPAYNRRHNMARTSLYNKWNGIKNRCCNPNSAAYKNYGGRGIKMCDEWRNAPDRFFDWSKQSGYNDNLSIERIDVNGDYTPENCTWIPKPDQAKNRRSNYSITYNGKTQNLQQWCDELGLDYKLIHNRLSKLKWSFERAITESCHAEKRNLTKRGDCNG